MNLNKFFERDLYQKYKNVTLGFNEDNFLGIDGCFGMFEDFTNIPKSKYDNVIGWIRQC